MLTNFIKIQPKEDRATAVENLVRAKLLPSTNECFSCEDLATAIRIILNAKSKQVKTVVRRRKKSLHCYI